MWTRGAVTLAFVLLPMLSASVLAEWFDDYERGVQALRKGDFDAAVRFLDRAARRRAEPGENVITYGTNRLKSYHPYLRT